MGDVPSCKIVGDGLQCPTAEAEKKYDISLLKSKEVVNNKRKWKFQGVGKLNRQTEV